MIVIRVELWSAVTGKKTELARMHICNDGTGTRAVDNYLATVFRGRSSRALDKGVAIRSAGLRNYPRLRLHVWNLVARALTELGYR